MENKMKKIFILFLLLIILTFLNNRSAYANSPYSLLVPLDGGKNINVDVLWPDIPQDRASLLVHLADRSTVSKDPIHQQVSGMMMSRDRIVLTKNLMIWFSFSGPLGGITNGGGGFVRGVWTIGIDSGGFYNFTQIKNGSNWAPNEFLPGSDGNNAQGSGISFLGNIGQNIDDPNLSNAFAAENSGVREFNLMGMIPITDGGWGDNIGYFYQTKGLLTHSQSNISLLNQAGYKSIHDMNPAASKEVNVEYILTYRILPDKPVFQYTLTLTPKNGPVENIATFVLSHNAPGSNGYQHRFFKTNTGIVTFMGCTRAPEFPANEVIPINVNILKWWQNATQGVPGTKWILMENNHGVSGRTFVLEPLLYSPYTVPNNIMVVRNDYSSGNGQMINAYDIQYTDSNQCGGNVTWPENKAVWLGAQLTYNDQTLPGDLNSDGNVDVYDLRQAFSGAINIFNYNLVVGNFGK